MAQRHTVEVYEIVVLIAITGNVIVRMKAPDAFYACRLGRGQRGISDLGRTALSKAPANALSSGQAAKC